MTKANKATEKMTAAATEATAKVAAATEVSLEKSQEFFAKSTKASEKLVEGVIEYNASAFKGAEVVAKKAYDNYVANTTTAYEDAKALAKTSDVAGFYKLAQANFSKAAEAYTAQAKDLAELSQKVLADNTTVAKKLYKETFAG
ncbi:hypothetical protein GCM10007939_02080 [Amylibacter marinus]|uniref:Phasin domain-containing protein n=1 Tax=Amylibacter marinus TaxID=1475483 RepID=A0ABQ5VRI9_9RHOB|nr:phasin family protein [Amylibacter marinus]GLQ33925.1 hypothetical protein GCM10007939_02080 [Amylibacter marinus]